MKKIILCFFIFKTVVIFSQKTEYYQQHANYKIFADVDTKNFTYQGKQEITYTNNSPDELNILYFHLYWNAFKRGSMMDKRVQNQGINADKRLSEKNKNGKIVSRLASIPLDEEGNQNIHWIKQNGKNVKFEIQGTIMKVYLSESIKPRSQTSLTMEWDSVIPYQIRRSGRNNKEGIDMTMTQWYPKLAEYDYDGWATFDYVGREFHAPFSDFDVTINIDKDYIIGAGGTLKNPKEVKGYDSNAQVIANNENKATWHWKAHNILDFAWAADKDYSVESFIVPDGPEVYFIYQKNEKTKYWQQTKPYISKYYQLMNATFGRYLYPSYSFIQGGDGGMEYGMCSIILGNTKSLENLLSLMMHEGSHSWFQQMLASNESMKPWLDEGFTNYAEDYAMYALYDSHLVNPFIHTISNYIEFTKTGKEEPASWLGDHHDNSSAYTVASYYKGELFLVELGYIMGEENLKSTLKEYYDKWHLKHPTDRDFLHIAQKISGMDLKWFHNYWINTTKTIDYSIKNVTYNPTSTTITLQNVGTVPMPIDFDILTKDKKIHHFHIPLNMMRYAKKSDYFGSLTTLKEWNWTDLEYTFEIPFTKNEILSLGIDFSQRLADVHPENNRIEIQ